MVSVPIRGVVSLYGGEVVEGEGASGDLVLILGSLVAGVVSGPAPSHLMHGKLRPLAHKIGRSSCRERV